MCRRAVKGTHLNEQAASGGRMRGKMAAKKKILILNPYVATMGGGEKHMGYLCQFMEEYYNNEVEIDILVHSNEVFDVFAPDFVTVEDLNRQFNMNLKHTRIRKIDLPRVDGYRQYLIDKRIIENITKEYDVFINFMFLSRHIGKAKKNIYEVMFPPVQYHWEYTKTIFHKLAGAYLDWRYIRSYDVMISNSQFTNRWQTEYWGRAEKNVVVYPPVFSEKEIENRYVESKKKNIIISVGRFFVAAHSKKQLEMVQFFVAHQDIFGDYEYHLCGAVADNPDDRAYLQQVRDEAAKVNNVVIHEACSYETLMDLYSQAKIFWHGTGYMVDEEKEPQKMEHFGITTVEAMSYGAVPVVINKGGQRETVEEGVNGFRWDNEEECVTKTKMLIEDDSLRQRLAKKSAELAKNYSIEKFYEANRRIFDAYKI